VLPGFLVDDASLSHRCDEDRLLSLAVNAERVSEYDSMPNSSAQMDHRQNMCNAGRNVKMYDDIVIDQFVRRSSIRCG
jgi:hypothetical protein